MTWATDSMIFFFFFFFCTPFSLSLSPFDSLDLPKPNGLSPQA
jgi:hypothetical protein